MNEQMKEFIDKEKERKVTSRCNLSHPGGDTGMPAAVGRGGGDVRKVVRRGKGEIEYKMIIMRKHTHTHPTRVNKKRKVTRAAPSL